ncbi:Fe-S cluster assembly ATPase SufC [bacterium]|nr:Fe-S cluster assembly ATPase SufC [bacterium]
MLTIDSLVASIGEDPILNGLSLHIPSGEVHAIMGPNGSGKSTLSKVLAGHPAYQVTAGSAVLDGVSLLDLDPEERALAGLFLAFQYPVEVPGVQNEAFLKMAYNAHRKAKGLSELDAVDFAAALSGPLSTVQLDEALLSRSLNHGFSGGEKKRNEVLQMALLNPKMAILDEIDSGLDIDALRTVASAVNALRSPDRSFLLITHYQRLLSYIEPDVVHIMANGVIVKTGDKQLALEGPPVSRFEMPCVYS